MKQQAGFTLIETLIAIFILTLTIGGLLTLAAGGYFSVRYSRNQIVANSLLQESLEYVRNSRDTLFQQNGDWNQWLAGFSDCFTTAGCAIDPYTRGTHVVPAAGQPIIFYPTFGFYGYAGGSYPSIVTSGTAPYLTTYVRTVTMKKSDTDPNQVIVNATVAWLNGSTQKTATQSILITNWNGR